MLNTNMSYTVKYNNYIMILWFLYYTSDHYKYIDSTDHNNMGCIVKWGEYNLMCPLYECVYNWYSMIIKCTIKLIMRLQANKPPNDKYIYKFNKIWVNTNYRLMISEVLSKNMNIWINTLCQIVYFWLSWLLYNYVHLIVHCNMSIWSPMCMC
jgi:hypothetical protein